MPAACLVANVDVPGCHQVTVRIATAANGADVGWFVPEACPTVLREPGGLQDHAVSDVPVCLAPGEYTFRAIDVYGDGWEGGTVQLLLRGWPDALTPATTVSDYGVSLRFRVPGAVASTPPPPRPRVAPLESVRPARPTTATAPRKWPLRKLGLTGTVNESPWMCAYKLFCNR